MAQGRSKQNPAQELGRGKKGVARNNHVVSIPLVRVRHRVGIHVPAVVVPVRVHSPDERCVRHAIRTTAC